MEPTITPEPTPGERAAILEALRRHAAGLSASSWWQAGLAEALAEDVCVDRLDISAPTGP